MKRVFVSHAYIDRSIAERLVDKLLVDTIGIHKSQIFFTSTRDTGIPSRVAWRDHIKKEIQSCKLFIAIITPNYHLSQMCQAEIGAAWVLDKAIYSTYLPPISTQNFSVVIGEKQADNLRKKEEVRSFISTLRQDYNRIFQDSELSDDIEEGIKKFQKSLRSYLRKNASELGLEYSENLSLTKKKTANSSIELPPLDLEKIKAEAKKGYPVDFSMQEHVINEQKTSYQELIDIIISNKENPEFKGILDRAFIDYPNDYPMVVHIVNEQLDSLSRLN